MKHNKLRNHRPLTWACACGQMNLMEDHECRSCSEPREVAWDPSDKERALYYLPPPWSKDPKKRWKIAGFNGDDGKAIK